MMSHVAQLRRVDQSVDGISGVDQSPLSKLHKQLSDFATEDIGHAVVTQQKYHVTTSEEGPVTCLTNEECRTEVMQEVEVVQGL